MTEPMAETAVAGPGEPIYRIDERPPSLWESLLYGWQHTLVDISPFVLPLAVAGALGMSTGEKAQFINFCLFAMGLATLLQTTIGNRLPIIQGPSATLTGTLAPVASQMGAAAMWGGVFAGAAIEAVVGASRILGLRRRFLPAAVSGWCSGEHHRRAYSWAWRGNCGRLQEWTPYRENRRCHDTHHANHTG